MEPQCTLGRLSPEAPGYFYTSQDFSPFSRKYPLCCTERGIFTKRKHHPHKGYILFPTKIPLRLIENAQLSVLNRQSNYDSKSQKQLCVQEGLA